MYIPDFVYPTGVCLHHSYFYTLKKLKKKIILKGTLFNRLLLPFILLGARINNNKYFLYVLFYQHGMALSCLFKRSLFKIRQTVTTRIWTWTLACLTPKPMHTICSTASFQCMDTCDMLPLVEHILKDQYCIKTKSRWSDICLMFK